MTEERITIRNMVCDRCKAAVARVLEAQGLPVRHIDLGEVELLRALRAPERAALRGALPPVAARVPDHPAQGLHSLNDPGARMLRCCQHDSLRILVGGFKPPNQPVRWSSPCARHECPRQMREDTCARRGHTTARV